MRKSRMIFAIGALVLALLICLICAACWIVNLPMVMVRFDDKYISNAVTYVWKENSLSLYASSLPYEEDLSLFSDYLIKKTDLSPAQRLNLSTHIMAIKLHEKEMKSDKARGSNYIAVNFKDKEYSFYVDKVEHENSILVPEEMKEQAELAVVLAELCPPPETYTTPGLKREIKLNEIPGWISECSKEKKESVIITN